VASITLHNVSTSYCLRKVNLEVAEGEFMVVLGPSGAGKSTILNAVAGLISYTGSVYISGKNVDKLSPEQRKVGYVFQDLYLFPHMTIFDNTAFGLKARGVSRCQIEQRVLEILDYLKIYNLKDRFPNSLSGGEKQRAALARALVLKPKIMLMDEPLSSVDYSLAKYLRMEFKDLQKRLGFTTIYVTHNFNEAREMADKIAVIVDGRIMQVGETRKVFSQPVPEIRNFIPFPNLLDCEEYEMITPGLAKAKCNGLTLLVPWEGEFIDKISILPNDISVFRFSPPGPSINRYQGQIVKIYEQGLLANSLIKLGDNVLRAEIPKELLRTECLKVGDIVWVKFNMRKIQVFGKNQEVSQ
jgi:ABC-type sugar transport system ATPase subunit